MQLPLPSPFISFVIPWTLLLVSSGTCKPLYSPTCQAVPVLFQADFEVLLVARVRHERLDAENGGLGRQGGGALRIFLHGRLLHLWLVA